MHWSMLYSIPVLIRSTKDLELEAFGASKVNVLCAYGKLIEELCGLCDENLVYSEISESNDMGFISSMLYILGITGYSSF